MVDVTLQCPSACLWGLTQNSGLHWTQQHISVRVRIRQECERLVVVQRSLVPRGHVRRKKHDCGSEPSEVSVHVCAGVGTHRARTASEFHQCFTAVLGVHRHRDF